MSEKTTISDRDEQGFPESALERELIGRYLAEKGYTRADLKRMPPEKARQLEREACRYAALKLAEIEARSEFRHKIEGPD